MIKRKQFITKDEMHDVLQSIAIATDTPIRMILAKGRHRQSSEPRHMLYHVLSRRGYGPSAICQAMKSHYGFAVNHSTIIHGRDKSQDWYEVDETWAEMIKSIEKGQVKTIGQEVKQMKKEIDKVKMQVNILKQAVKNQSA